jgi:hypothetical protein
MTDGTVMSTGKVPIEIAPRSLLRNALMDTGWLVVDIADLPIGTPLTLSYSLRTPKDSSHPTWAYFDEVNDPPTVTDRAYLTDKNTPLSVPAAEGVLESAYDPDGDALQASVVTTTTYGRLMLLGDGAFSYAPNFGFVGIDSFTFKACDGQADSGLGTARITVNSVNDSPRPDDPTIWTSEDKPVQITLTPRNHSGSPLTYYVVAPTTRGTLSGDAPTTTDGTPSRSTPPTVSSTGRSTPSGSVSVRSTTRRSRPISRL